jgi:membrane-associated phospholipid phosphatase
MPLILRFLLRIVLPVVVLYGVMIGLGLLITKVLDDVWPFTAEDSINRFFAGRRNGFFDHVTAFFTAVGNTPIIIAVTAVAAITLRLTLHRWREPLFLCAAVIAQAVVFFFTTLAIDRHRPAVPHMDESPPTSSFPSGHTSAAVALYAGLALVLTTLVRREWAKALCWLLVLVPVAVALSRLYRGMHHPSDVIASFLNGGVCIAIMAKSILDRNVSWSRAVLTGTKRSTTSGVDHARRT